MPIPEKKGMEITSVRYAADRIDPTIYFSDSACLKLVKIPRIFLNTALNSIVDQAKTMNLETKDGKQIINDKVLDIINDKRKAEKQK